MSLAVTHHVANNYEVFAVFTCLVVIVAGLSFQFYEGPVRRAIRARWGQPKKVEPLPVLPNMLDQRPNLWYTPSDS